MIVDIVDTIENKNYKCLSQIFAANTKSNSKKKLEFNRYNDINKIVCTKKINSGQIELCSRT